MRVPLSYKKHLIRQFHVVIFPSSEEVSIYVGLVNIKGEGHRITPVTFRRVYPSKSLEK